MHLKRNEYEHAMEQFQLAGNMGCAKGFGWAGYLCEQGLGTARDLNKAASFYEKASAGYFLAERALIRLTFRHGSLVAKMRAIPRFLLMLMRAGVIAYRIPDDERIKDVPSIKLFER